MNADETERVFFDVAPEDGVPDLIMFDFGHFKAPANDPGHRRKKQADQINYEWDALIERFVRLGEPGIHWLLAGQEVADSEKGLRLMAAETRYRRRLLAQSFIGVLRRAEPGMHLGRPVYSGVASETVFVFVVAAKKADESYDEYRQYRIGLLHAYVQTAKLKAPFGTTFVGLAFDNQHKYYPGGSDDLFVLSKNDLTERELVSLETKREEFRLWDDAMEMSRFRQDEFPQENQRIAMERIPHPHVLRSAALTVQPVTHHKPRQAK